ncbi:hypothetical protein [Isoptericola sp. NPDC058082]|uniref:hypothetical protein n=1 Tax=Isoptericola sp. NPDC058082 TaxID=3346331 RepID=UPI0036ECD18F
MPTQTLPIPTDAGARDALLERVRALAALRHPCVEPVVAVDVRDDGTLALRRGGAATDLPTVLAVRGRLTSREAAGVLVTVARGLAALHSAGLRQGSVGAQDVVLDPGGSALLRPRADLAGADGADGVADDPAAGEAADVHALARLVADLLGDRGDDDATALRAVLAPAAAPDPRVRPEAGTLAAQADTAVATEPVRLPEPAALAAAALGRSPVLPVAEAPVRVPRRRAVRRADGGRAGRPASRSARRTTARRRGGTGRRVLGLVGAVGVVAVLTAVAVQVRAPDPAPSSVAEDGPATGRDAVQDDPTQDRADPGAAAAELTRRRVALITSSVSDPDPARWGAVDVPGSPAHEADVALLEAAAQAGTRVRGAEVRVEDSRAERAGEGGPSGQRDDGTADVVVRYAVTAHEQVAADGSVTAVPASDVRTATLRLDWTPDGWRVAEVS